jgi:DNA-binding NtrC family response regulator
VKKPKGRVLVVEDEAYVRDSLGAILAARGYDVSLASSAAAAMETLDRTTVDVVLTDLKMPGVTGSDLIVRIAARSPELPLIVLTGFGTIASAVECMRAGASDYILKPADPEAVDVAIGKALAAGSLRREVAYLRSERLAAPGPPGPAGEPVGRSEPWRRAMDLVAAAAAADATVLLLGESGTGKELLARRLHQLGPRRAGPYVRVNCSAIPIEMWESEFFGHRKGAFTGAGADREGRFRVAHQGTLFMDEVATMPLPAQAKMLRVLEEGEFDRLGEEQPTRVDVRVIAATNGDLDADVEAGRFRRDLFFRLNVVRIVIPPLRERLEDIPLLTETFAAEISRRLGRAAPQVDAATHAQLAAYPWPGNVRELRNVIERALILNPGETLILPDLPSAQGPDAAASAAAGDLNLRAALARREKEAVMEALQRAGGVRGEAARLLGIDPRNLAYYLRKHGIA